MSEKMKPHGIKFTDEDWQTVQQLASQIGITPGAFVNLACAQLARRMGNLWIGGKKWGRPRKNPSLQLERFEVKVFGLPPLADDDED